MTYIDGIHDLLERIEEYKAIFPNSYTTIEQIQERLTDRDGAPVGSIFGVSVADDWGDKCYGFEVDKVTLQNTIFKFVGIWKC